MTTDRYRTIHEQWSARVAGMLKHPAWHNDPDLGVVPDRVIAERAGVAQGTVKKYRQSVGIKSAHTTWARVWDDPWCGDPDIGHLPDQVIADRHGIPRKDVLYYRQRKGIRRYPIIDWTAFNWTCQTDQEIATRTGRTHQAVNRMRHRHGVARNGLGPPDPVVEWGMVPLGFQSDKHIASRIGLDKVAVARARHHYGIPSANGTSNWKVVEHWFPLLPDAVIAGICDVSVTLVDRARCRRLIPPPDMSEREAGLWVKAHTRRKRHKTNTGKATRYRVMERDGFACRYCGKTVADGIKLHVDHVRPDSKGGTSKDDNLATACDACNEGKWNRHDTPPPPLIEPTLDGLASIARDLLA